MTTIPESEFDRRRRVGRRLLVAFLALSILVLVMPRVVRAFSTSVPAGRPYTFTGAGPVFVRGPARQYCTVDRAGERSQVDVPGDPGDWSSIEGRDVPGTNKGSTIIVCEVDSEFAGGIARAAIMPFRYGLLLSLLCPLLVMWIIWYGLRTVYLRLRHTGGYPGLP